MTDELPFKVVRSNGTDEEQDRATEAAVTSMAPDLDSGKEWSEMDFAELRICLRLGQPIEEIAERLCRGVEEVAQKIKSVKEAEEVVPPIGDPLALRRDSDRDCFDVISGGQVVGRIYCLKGAPQDRRWMWVMTGAFVAPTVPWRGFAATPSEAKTAFAGHWRRWLAMDCHQGIAHSASASKA
jgi:hypothetical protein